MKQDIKIPIKFNKEMKQTALASKLGVSESKMSRIINGGATIHFFVDHDCFDLIDFEKAPEWLNKLNDYHNEFKEKR